ncbi:Hpt domain-containing protein [Halorussus gelatinilyticus]|uniref:histidine kinase n=1 Tax=Halorussus gelatinilyticus TaxID=2937524 RepID=A0A8U0IFE9_9EURY|nr:ATP-binding protein [Halorussus gelatinilyticus]UPV99474.1 Hpt domain-containing protein [Halorussus gelatinilyticus]
MAPTDDAFFREAKSQIRALNDGLLAVERGDAEVEVADLFRVAHSLKGSCRTHGLDDAGDLAHAVEDVLDALRAGEVEPTPDLVDAALDAVDLLEATVRAAAVGGQVKGDAAATRAALREALDVARAESPGDPGSGEPSESLTLDGPASGLGDSDDWDPADDDLSDDVVAALEETDEFDDLDALLDEVDAPEDDEELDGWGMLDDEAGRERDEDPDRSSEPAESSESAEAPESTETPEPAETPDEPSSFFEQTKAEVGDDADIDALQEDIDAVEFGEFDDEDEYTIEELMELEPDDPTDERSGDLTDEASGAGAPAPDADSTETSDDSEAGDDPLAMDPPAADDPNDRVELPPDLLGVGPDADDETGERTAESTPDSDPLAADDPNSESVGDPLGLADADPSSDDAPTVETGETDDTDDSTSGDPGGTEPSEPESTESDDGTDDASETNTFVFGDEAETESPWSGELAQTDDPVETDELAETGDHAETGDPEEVASGEASAAPAADADASPTEDGASEAAGDAVSDVVPDSVPDADDVPDSDLVPDSDTVPDADSVPETASLPDADPTPDDDSTPDPESMPETDLGVDLDADFDADLGDAEGSPDAAATEMDVSVDDEMAEFESRFGDRLGERAGDDDEDGAVFRSAVTTIEESRLDAERFPTGGRADRELEGDEFDRLQAMTVDVDTADELLNVAEELSLTHLRLDEAVGPGTDDAIREEVSNLLRVLTKYRRTVMDVRLMPLETAIETIPRTVRDVARSQGKEVELAVSDADVELDRSIVDRLRDPLVHLARNAVDHGIESPDEREAAGKPRAGTVEISAERVGDEVVVELADDGRGVEPEAVRERAVENGVCSRAEADRLSDDETYDLLFEPGLTTAEEVTDVSGRGVGMDVVNRTVADLNGSVSVESEPGYGTTVRLRVPVSIALTEVLFVEAEGQTFGIPMASVEQITAAPPVEESEGREVVRRSNLDLVGGLPEGVEADDAYPLRSLRSALDLAERDDAALGSDADSGGTPTESDGPAAASAADPGAPDSQIVWIRHESGRLALRCDRVVASQEVVVRPYGDLLRDVPGVSGATTLGDGEAVNVLDVATL